MILVDASVWIDHLHTPDPVLIKALNHDEAGSHPAVIEELALGSIRSRNEVLSSLEDLFRFPLLSHAEVMSLIPGRRLWGRGLSAADCHLLGSVALVDGAQLFTRDKRLLEAADDAGIPRIDDAPAQ